MQNLFLYRFVFLPYKNPPGRKDHFEEGLKAYLQSNGLNYGMSALGGMRLTMGIIYRDDGAVMENDRKSFATWALAQPISCDAHLGKIEDDHPDLQLFREIDDWVFQINNLTEQDRVEAANYLRKTEEVLDAALNRG